MRDNKMPSGCGFSEIIQQRNNMKTTTLAILAIASAMLTSCAPASIVSGAAYWSEQAREADRLSPEGEQVMLIKVKQMLDSEGKG